MKRGQVTLFVVLGIIVVSVIGLGIYFREAIVQEKAESQVAERALVAPEVQAIYDHVFDCVEKTTKDSLNLIGLQGGYLQPPEGAIELEDEGISIALGYDKGESRLPPLARVKDDMASYVDAFLPECVNVQLFEGFSFEETMPTTKVSLEDNMVKFIIDYPIVAKKGDATYTLDEPYTMPYLVRLQRIYDISSKIIEREIKNPASEIDVNFMLDLGVDIDVLAYEDDVVVYLLTDTESVVDELPYIFMFANRYEK